MWEETDWLGVGGNLVAHADLWVTVLDLLSRLGSRVTVFHVHSHINSVGNHRADELANPGRLCSGHYARGITPNRPCKRPRPDPPDVLEVDVVLSSDEELESRYQNARRCAQHLRIPTVFAPPLARKINFDRASTPNPDSPQDFSSQDFLTPHKAPHQETTCDSNWLAHA